jgi:hypothetical protein
MENLMAKNNREGKVEGKVAIGKITKLGQP